MDALLQQSHSETAGVTPDQLTVLIADDHPLIIAGIRRTIEHVEDMHVIGEAQSGAELTQLIERRRPDIVLMDLRMPGVSGTEMIDLISERWPDTKTIVLSACDDTPTIESVLGAGASAYVLKTAASLDITSIIRQAASGAVVPAPATAAGAPRGGRGARRALADRSRARHPGARGRRHDDGGDQPRALGLRAHDQVPPDQHLSQAGRAQPRGRGALRPGARDRLNRAGGQSSSSAAHRGRTAETTVGPPGRDSI